MSNTFSIQGLNVDKNYLHVPKSYSGRREVLLLIAVGVIAGVISGLTLWASETLSKAQALLIDHADSSIAPGGYFISAIALAIIAAVIIKYFCKQAAGSGLPEFKSILAGELPPSERVRLVSFRIFIAKVIGLILATGSGLSIGTEGPLVHISACIAQALMTLITEFGDILDSPTLSKQVFAASAAVGISSAFNAPVGGLLFSVEITTTFYLISNYYKSFVAAMAGAFASSIFLITKQNSSQSSGAALEMTISTTPFVKWELLIFALMGFTFAYLANIYLKISQHVHLLMKPYCVKHPILTVGAVAGLTAMVIYFTGSYSSEGLRVFVMASDILTTGDLAEMRKFESIPPLVGLLISFFTRSCITILGFNLPIPAGIFVPVFLIGGILGRFVGMVISQAGLIDAYLPGYALVGGCAFAAGVTQTISVAVVAVELTGNISMLLPCLIASVIAAGVTRTLGLSVYDQAMFNKNLQSLQLLLRESMHNFRFASDVMLSGKDIVCIPRHCSSLYLLHIMDENRDSQFPVVDALDSRKLIGTLGRSEIFAYLRGMFHEWSMDDLLAILLPEDSHEWGNKANREASMEENKRLRTMMYNSLTMKFCAECVYPDFDTDVQVPDVPRTKQRGRAETTSSYDFIPRRKQEISSHSLEDDLDAREMEEGEHSTGGSRDTSNIHMQNDTVSNNDADVENVSRGDYNSSYLMNDRDELPESADASISSRIATTSTTSVFETTAMKNVMQRQEVLFSHQLEEELHPHEQQQQLERQQQRQQQLLPTRNRNVSWAPTLQKNEGVRSSYSPSSSYKSSSRIELDINSTEKENIGRPRVLSFVEIAVNKVSQFLQELPEGSRQSPIPIPVPADISTEESGLRVGSSLQDHELGAPAVLSGMKRSSSIENALDSYQLRRRSESHSRESNITGIGRVASLGDLNILHKGTMDRTLHTLWRQRAVKNALDRENHNMDFHVDNNIISASSDVEMRTDFKDALKVDIDLLQQKYTHPSRRGSENILTVSAFPFSVTKTTSMEHIYVLLEMVKLLHIYVQEDGKLIGVISRRKLLANLKASQNP